MDAFLHFVGLVISVSSNSYCGSSISVRFLFKAFIISSQRLMHPNRAAAAIPSLSLPVWHMKQHRYFIICIGLCSKSLPLSRPLRNDAINSSVAVTYLHGV